MSAMPWRQYVIKNIEWQIRELCALCCADERWRKIAEEARVMSGALRDSPPAWLNSDASHADAYR